MGPVHSAVLCFRRWTIKTAVHTGVLSSSFCPVKSALPSPAGTPAAHLALCLPVPGQPSVLQGAGFPLPLCFLAPSVPMLSQQLRRLVEIPERC